MTETTESYGDDNNWKPQGGVSMNGVPVAKAEPYDTSSSPAQTGVAPTGVSAVPMREQPKIGKKCCNCCCDFRMAVIIIDIIGIALSVFGLALLALPSEDLYEAYRLDEDEEEALEVYSDSITATAIISGIGIVALAVPLYGAVKYNAPMVGFGIVWLVATFIAAVVIDIIYINKANEVKQGADFNYPFLSYLVNAVVTGLLIYPHAGLMMEIKQGIMSDETYPREQYCCCCN